MQPHRFKPESPFHRVADTLMSVPRAWAPRFSRNYFALLSPRGVMWALFFMGFASILSNWHSEVTGRAYSGGRAPRLVLRVDKPQEFHDLMTYKWWESTLWFAGGMMVRGMIRRQDRLDPMSPDFKGQKALDELGECLDREIEHRNEPLR